MIRLLEPELCTTCRFAGRARVNGEPVIHCNRGDCDNWDRVIGRPQGETLDDLQCERERDS